MLRLVGPSCIAQCTRNTTKNHRFHHEIDLKEIPASCVWRTGRFANLNPKFEQLTPAEMSAFMQISAESGGKTRAVHLQLAVY